MKIRSSQELSSVIRSRRKALGLKQGDMLMKIGMTQQQYQGLEAAKTDVRLSSLLRIIEGLGLELILVPKHQHTHAGSAEPIDEEITEIDPLLASLGDDDAQ